MFKDLLRRYDWSPRGAIAPIDPSFCSRLPKIDPGIPPTLPPQSTLGMLSYDSPGRSQHHDAWLIYLSDWLIYQSLNYLMTWVSYLIGLQNL